MIELSALLQLADAAFPAGGFGHSFGLETAIVEGRVHDAPTLGAWIGRYLVEGSATLDGAAMALFMRAATPLMSLDDRLCAAQPNTEIRRANRHLARATLDTYGALGLADPAIVTYRAAIAEERCGGIHSLAAATGYRAIGAPPQIALEAHATTIVAACASVAARAVPLGQRDVARVRWTLRGAIATFVRRALAARGIDDLASSAVACEIDGLRHRRLPARLFAS
jgi:urease accessory protein